MPMQPGQYYIGDLCNVLKKEWEEYCAIVIKGDEVLDGEFTLNDGRRFASYSTMYGDGLYDGVAVDSGSIGCLRIDDIQGEFSEEQLRETGRIIDFPSVFSTRGDPETGIIELGHITFDTSE